jgi:RNA polymerase sigma-70 factor, ECF subfamily
VDSTDSATDGEIVRAVLAGDVERFAVLVSRYRDRHARYAARMLGSLDAAEDAVQDALIRAFDRLADCRDPEKFAGWLFLILRNRCFAERRRYRRQAIWPDDAAGIETPEDSALPARQGELGEALKNALGELTAEQRDAFVLKHVDGLSYKEMAELTGTSVASLKMRVHRAYDRLRDLMKDHL